MSSLRADNLKVIYILAFPESPSDTRSLCYHEQRATMNSWQFTLWRLKSWLRFEEEITLAREFNTEIKICQNL